MKRKAEASTNKDGQTPPLAKKSTRTECRFCGKLFNKGNTFFNHLNKDHGDKVDPDDKALADHRVYKHEPCKLKISQSPNNTDSSLDTSIQDEVQLVMPKNVETEKVSSRLNCPFCENAFNKEERLQGHIKSSHKVLAESEMLQCQQCDYFLPNQADLHSHKEAKHSALKPVLISNQRDTIGEIVQQEPKQECYIAFNIAHSEESEVDPDVTTKKDQRSIEAEARGNTTQGSFDSFIEATEIVQRSTGLGIDSSATKNSQDLSSFSKSTHLPYPASLVKHSQKHNQEQAKIECHFCERKYCRQKDFVSHVNKVHRDDAVKSNWFSCGLCNLVYLNEYSLKRHAGNAHKIKSPKGAVKKPKETINNCLQASMMENRVDHIDKVIKTEPEEEPEQQDANEGDLSMPLQANEMLPEEPSLEDGDNGNCKGFIAGCEKDFNSSSKAGNVKCSKIATGNESSDEGIEEISLIDSDGDEATESTPNPKLGNSKILLQSAQTFPRKTTRAKKNSQLKKEYFHNGIYPSRDCFEIGRDIVMKMDYKRQTSNVYFPEVGPYRCEICFSILQTNRLFFDHIIGKHRADADETAIDKMKQHLNGAHRQHQNECFSTTMLKF